MSVKQNYLIKARLLLINKYSNNLTNKYNILKINEILSNSKSRLVSSFKDYLLYEDYSEFFKRYYNGKESFIRIKKLTNNLYKNSYISPNYASIEEGKCVLSNILRKQMIINKQKRIKYQNCSNSAIKKASLEKKYKVFNNDIYDDIIAQQKSESFINLLFGLDSKNNESSETNENDELNKIIKMIEINENLYLKKSADKIIVNTCLSFKRKINNNYNKIIKNQKNILRKVQNNSIFPEEKNKLNIENTLNEETTDNSKINQNSIINQKLFNNKKIIYHRKVKSSLYGNMTKLELYSNSNIANILKVPNQTLIEFQSVQNISKEILSKNKIDYNNNNKIQIKKLPKEKKEDNITYNKNNLSKLTRNNQNNNYEYSTSVFNKGNKNVYVKNKVLKDNMSNGNIFSSTQNEYKRKNNKRKFIKLYSKPKCIYKEIKYNKVPNKTYYNKQNESNFIQKLK